MSYKPIELLCLALMLLVVGCSESQRQYQNEPIDDLIKKYRSHDSFSIILDDMNYDKKSNKYQHLYQVIYTSIASADTIVRDSATAWLVVSPRFFNKHIDDMGMELAYKKNGKVEKKTAPPGYGDIVGNEKYGRWQSDSGGRSFWVFYGQYRLFSDLFYLGRYPYYRSYYNDYYTGYYGSGRSYYGPMTDQGYAYGTKSQYNANTRSSSSWNKQSSTFKSDVRRRVKRSSQTSRSSSRYKGSSSRGRSGGVGK